MILMKVVLITPLTLKSERVPETFHQMSGNSKIVFKNLPK